ncbi:RHS repeat-associated core domain-containing protein [Anaerosoma tenue]|uniref:RHS repeat-associated core domain-containing protein n=1 Tax=Anaerosoma tenue TaxID=2933588 RepID=UPI002260DA82|nr:RHS repeat-associated core domain-containing protein [Anaerosoma tenue]MCK8114327.1 RHS repeat-associated core domain-containing protein [Anaerosoma tenue]
MTYAYHTDALGSVVAITSPSGAVVATYAYDPYGGVTQVGGSDAALAERNPLRYRAYYHDTTTGHYYLPARYYDPDTMRFLSPDPAPPSAGDPLTLNRYACCVGDPVDMSDPSGAVIDVDGDGTLDVEDTWSQSYLRTSPSASRRNQHIKAARRAGMVSAVGDSSARRMSARGVSQMAIWEYRAAIANTPADHVWRDETMFVHTRANIGVWSFGWTVRETARNWMTYTSADSLSFTYDPISWPDLGVTQSRSTRPPTLGVSVEGPSATLLSGWPAPEGGSLGGTPSTSLCGVTYCMYANTSPLYGADGVPSNR